MGEDTLKQYTITDGHTLAYRGRYLRQGDTIRLDDESMATFSAEVRARFKVVEEPAPDAVALNSDESGPVERPPPPAKGENKTVHAAYAIDVLKLPQGEVNKLGKDAIIALIKKNIEEADAAA